MTNDQLLASTDGHYTANDSTVWRPERGPYCYGLRAVEVGQGKQSPIKLRRVVGYHCYASADGSILSHYSHHRLRVCTPFWDAQGRLSVTVHVGAQTFRVPVADLMLRAFRGPAPAGYVAVHRDANCENNKISNLRWGKK